MLRKLFCLSSCVAVLILTSSLYAQRGGGRGGGGRPGGGRSPEPNRNMNASRGPSSSPSRGPGASGGGFGGGLSPRNEPQTRPASGPHGGGSENPFGNRPGTGGGNSTVPGRNPRPGMLGPGGTQNTPNVRPRPGTGGTGTNPAVPVRPGTGQSGTGGPASGIGVLPGAGAGRPGSPTVANGTRYTSNQQLNAQAASVRAASVSNPTYNVNTYNTYANAWRPTNVNAGSLYQNPGYAAVAATVGLAAQPAHYDYGGNIVAQPTAVYVNGSAPVAPQQYAAQASEIANTGAAAPQASDGKWMPLGVFALVEGDATNSDDVFQLAVSPEGVIRGNYHNVASDQMEALAGSVDKQTQRAAWTIGGDKTPVYEAGIANLTRDVTPILIHLGDGQSRQMTLVRLPQPQN